VHGGEAREVFNDNLLVRIHFIIVMIRWTGLALIPFSRQGQTRLEALGPGVEVHGGELQKWAAVPRRARI